MNAARRRREVSTGRILVLTLTGGLVGSAITVLALTIGGAFVNPPGAAPGTASPATALVAQPTPISADLTGEKTRWTEVVRNLTPSLARIEAGGSDGQADATAVALRTRDDDTYFVTSEDPVRGLRDVTLVLSDGRRRKAAVIGSDQYTNLAVLEITGERIAVPNLDAVTPLQAGADAVVVASPPRQADSPRVAKTLVSSVNHKQPSETGTMVHGLLQTDANITSEFKGGALVDANGSLVGMLALMKKDETGVERVGYALPADVVIGTADALIATGFPTRVWLGVQGIDLPFDAGETIGLAGGALIQAVVSNSPAQQCTLQPNDVVVKLNNTTVDSMSAFVLGLRELQPNDTVSITYYRQGESLMCLTTLTRPPAAGSPSNGGELATVTTTPTTAAPPSTPTPNPTTGPIPTETEPAEVTSTTLAS